MIKCLGIYIINFIALMIYQCRIRIEDITTFRLVADRYEREIIPEKGIATQRTNKGCLKWLREYFNDPDAPLEAITPQVVYKYMDWRKASPVVANKEKALLHHIWKKAVKWGYTEKPNPCTGVESFKEHGRDRYVEDGEFKINYDAADQTVKDTLDLAYLTGQRPADLLKMMETDIKDGCLWITQNKTGKKLRMAITGELAVVIDRIMARKASHAVRSLYLIVDETGGRFTYPAFSGRWWKLRKQTGVDFQLRDLRAKAATDKAESKDDYAAQKQLGHGNVSMTHSYIRNRKGDKVDPTK